MFAISQWSEQVCWLLWFYSGFNFTSSSRNNVDTYQKIAETFKFGYALRTYLGDELFTNVSEVIIHYY